MKYQPELLATAGDLVELERLFKAGANAIVVGEQRFGMRLAGEFSLEDIKQSVVIAKKYQARIYVSMNNIMLNEILDELDQYVDRLIEIGVDAIIFGDPAVLRAVRAKKPGFPLHWNTEMTSTNYGTAEYWRKRGATRYVLARELNMDQIIETKSKTDMPIEVQVHGMTNIYHSKRSLVQHYLAHTEEPDKLSGTTQKQGLYLMEEERPNERFPIYEDEWGTHIMSSSDVCMLENLHELLEICVDSLKIEGLLKSADYNETVVRAYRQAIDAYLADPNEYEFDEAWLEPIQKLQDAGRELSFGFFYKEQVY